MDRHEESTGFHFGHAFFLLLAAVFHAITHLIGAAVDFSALGIERGRAQRERERLDEDVRNLTQSLKLRAAAIQIPDRDALWSKLVDRIMEYAFERNSLVPAKSVWNAYTKIAWELYQTEKFGEIEPPTYTNEIEKARYVDYLLKQAEKHKDAEKVLAEFIEALAISFVHCAKHLPDSFFIMNTDGVEQPSVGTIPLTDLIDNLPEMVLDVISPCLRPDSKALGLFAPISQHLRSLDDKYGDTLLPIDEFKGTPKQLLDLYLGSTPFRRLFDTPVPFQVPLSKQLEYSMIAAGSRYGKSQLIGSIIGSHLQNPDPPGMIVIDSTGDFVRKISKLDLFAPGRGRLANRLLIIDPADAPQLNMFDISNLRSKGYGKADLEQVEADVTNLFNYVFASVGTEFTSQQGAGFTFLVRLLLFMPGSTLDTLKNILELPTKSYRDVPKPIQEAIEKLDPTTQSYFQNQFFGSGMESTRQAVARRLYLILQNQTFARMFTASNRIDFFQAMQDGMIIVVDTSFSLLQKQASALFGRYIISRVMSGAYERTVIKDMNKRRPCLLFVDEASEYFDANIDELLTKIGKYRLGLCIAFQYFGQLDEKLRGSVLGNTTVKYAGGLKGTEPRMIARDLRVDEEFVRAQRKDPADTPKWAQFATQIDNMTDHAISLTVPFYALENMQKMSDAEHAVLLRTNKDSVSPTAAPPTPPPSSSAPPQPPADPIIEKPVKPSPKPKSTPNPEENDGSDWK